MKTSIKPKLQRFATATALACPLCGSSLQLEEGSLRCSRRHSYDLAKFGYVNLAPQIKQPKDYDKASFVNRQTVLEAGLYQHILAAILQILRDLPQHQTILDIGCGEGYYARKIQEQLPDRRLYAFDISKDSIQLAAKSDSSLAVNWFVGDLARLPLLDGQVDLILDIFSPANYQEFQRVLTDQGLLLKVIPSPEHLREIRAKAADQLSKEDYSNDQVIQHLQDHFQPIQELEVQASYPLTDSSREALLRMTPLLFHVDRESIDWTDLTQVTIAARLILARPK